MQELDVYKRQEQRSPGSSVQQSRNSLGGQSEKKNRGKEPDSGGEDSEKVPPFHHDHAVRGLDAVLLL